MFSENLKKLKAKWGMTHEDLAKLLDDPKINKDTISNLSRDNTTPSPGILAKLEVLTGVPMLELFSTIVDFDAFPLSPLSPDRVTDDGDRPVYKKLEWPTMGLREFFTRNEQIYLEVQQLSERMDALEKKKPH